MNLGEKLDIMSADIKLIEKILEKKPLLFNVIHEFFDEDDRLLLIWNIKDKRIDFLEPEWDQPRRLLECPISIRFLAYQQMEHLLTKIQQSEQEALKLFAHVESISDSLHIKLNEFNNFNR